MVPHNVPCMAVSMRAKLQFEDSLDTYPIHGLGGTIGAILIGVFALMAINPLGSGLLDGNPGHFWIHGICPQRYEIASQKAAGLSVFYPEHLQNRVAAEVAGTRFVVRGTSGHVEIVSSLKRCVTM